MTGTNENHLRELTRRLFGRDEHNPDEIESDPPGNIVPSEGSNPKPEGFTYEDHVRQLTREIFDPLRAATDPVTFNVHP